MANPQVISSKDNRWVRLCLSLQAGGKERKEFFIAEGSKHIKSLLQAYKPLALLTSQDFYPELNGLEEHQNLLQIVSNNIWPKLSELDSPVKLMAIFRKPQAELTNAIELADLLIVDRVQDPGNLGTIIRTAVAAGWENLVCLKGTVDPFSPKVVRATAGVLGALKVYTGVEPSLLLSLVEKCQLQLINTSSYAEQDLREVNLTEIVKPALVLSNEGNGGDSLLMKYPGSMALKLQIVNKQVESLNVAVAGAVLMYKLKGLI
jgi:RNA methyltransferase, TrmH family